MRVIGFWFTLLLSGLLVGGLGRSPDSGAAEPALPLPEPLPLRRVLIPAERVATELERVRQGVLVKLPRADFEARVQRAAQADENRRNPPRLIEARYRATLVDTALVGTGQWKVLHPAAAAGVLPVQPLNLALQKVRLQHAHADTTDAVLGNLDGKTLGLLVEQPGEQNVFLDWTARGDPSGEGVRFDLQVPASVVTSLELQAPADRVVTVDADTPALVSGPHPAEAPERRTWRLDFASRSQVRFTIRRGDSPGQSGALVLAPLQTRQDLGPDMLRAEFKFNLEMVRTSRREFRLECDPTLQPYEVDIGNLESWDLRRGGKPDAPSLLTVRLREPFRGGPLVVRCLGPLSTQQPWTCPGVRLQDAPDLGETILVRVAPGVRLEDWRPGNFRFMPVPGPTEPDDWLAFCLTRSGPSAATGTGARPSARLRMQTPEVRVRQLAWWQIGNASSLTVQVQYEVAREKVFQLPLLLPRGWQVDQVRTTPGELMRHWNVVSEKGQRRLVVDLQKGLEPSGNPQPGTPQAQLTVRLRPENPNAQPAVHRALAFPHLLPLGAYLREEVLGISIDPVFDAEVHTTAGTLSTDEKGPWGRQSPDHVYAARGQVVEGNLVLKPRQSRLRARCASEVMIALGRPIVLTRLSLQPDVGRRDSVTVTLSAPTTAMQDWKVRRGTNRLREVQRLRGAESAPFLSVLAGRTALEAACLLRAQPPAWEVYRLRFAQPLREPVLLETTFEVPGRNAGQSSGGEGQWPIPLPAVVDADPLEGEVALYLGGSELVQVAAEGLREGPSSPRPNTAPPWRTFRYGAHAGALTLHGRISVADRSTEAAADRAQLTTLVDEEGRLVHRYQFQLWHWRQRTLPVRLPVGARPVAAQADGRWVAPLQLETAAEGVTVLQLPVAGAGLHQFEIVYATDSPAWKLWTRLEAPAAGTSGAVTFRPWEPELPVRPVAFRHTWKLPPGVEPLWVERFHALPGGPATETELIVPDWLRRQMFGGPASVDAVTPEGADQRRHFLAAAGALIRKKLEAGKECRLGDLLDQLTVEQLQRQEPLVVDAAALAEAGLSPNTRLTAAPLESEGGAANPPINAWERLGLDIAPCRSALLLTTRHQLERWQAGTAPTGGPAEGVPQAVAEAESRGHDVGDRFQSLGEWLAGGTGLGRRQVESGSSDIGSIRLGNDWTEWEADAGESPAGTLVVVRADVLPGLGMTLGLATVLAAWLLRGRSRQFRLTLLAVWLCAAGLAFWWLPGALRPVAWWPVVSAAVVAGCWYVWAIAGNWKRPAVQPAAVASSLLALVSVLGLSSRAAAPAPATVLIVPGPKGTPDQETVLVPPDLIARMDEIARRGSVDPRQAVLTAADYEGTATAAGVDFQAEFSVYCLGPESATATLPLGGVQVREALCDGAAAQLQHFTRPVPAAPPEGYTLEVQGKGLHTVRVRFAVGVTAKGDDRDLKFSIPELTQSRLTLTTPAPTHHLQIFGYRGALRPATGAAGPQGCRVEVDLGRVAAVHARWYEDAAAKPSTPLLVREGYLWDLRPTGGTLAAVLQFTRAHGTIPSLTLQVPAETEVRNVGVGRLPQDEAEETGPRLRQWTVEGSGPRRRLHLEFQRPVTGGVQVVLELIARQPFGPTAVLPLPVPLKARTPDGAAQESFLAYRTTGLKARLVGSLGITGIRPSAFTGFWRAARMGDPGPELATFRFRRTAGGSLLARVELQPPDDDTEGVQSLDWTVGRQRAGFRLAVSLNTRDRTLAVVEWDVPKGVTVAEVSGDDVRDWAQTGARLQVWLRRPLTTCAMQLTGWKTLEGVSPARGKGSPGPAKAAPTFTLLPLRLVAHPHVANLVRVTADSTLSLEVAGLKHLWPLPNTRPVRGVFEYGTNQSDYQGTFRVHAGGAACEVAALTFAEVVDANLVFHAVLDCQVRQGELRTLTVRLRNWEGEVRLEAAGAEQRVQPGRERATRTWVLTLPPGVTDRFRCRIQGSMPLKPGNDVLMPDVSAAGPVRQERWVAVAGRELRAEDPHGLQPVLKPARTLTAWPAEAERVRRTGSAWRVQAPDWHMHLVASATGANPAPVQVVLAEQAAAVVDGQHWAHQATYWLYHEAGTDLTLSLPDGARVLEVVLDHTALTPLQPEPNRLWLPLSGPVGAHRLRLKWTYDGRGESLDQPRMEGVKLEGLGNCPVLWTIHVPAGYTFRVSAAQAEPSGAAMQDLHRAEAQYQLSTLLAERLRQNGGEALRAQLSAIQEQFYRFCRAAERQSAGHPPLEEYRRHLQEQNKRLAQSQGWGTIRVQAERRVRESPGAPEPGMVVPAASGAERTPAPAGDLLPHQGTPTYWETAETGMVLHGRLVSAQEERTTHALLASVLLVLLVLIAWAVSLFPRVVAWVQVFWPEQLLLVAVLGWWLLGMNWPSLVVGLAALVGRVVVVGGWLLALGRRRTATAAPAADSGVSAS